jgi:hypothetical protein
MVSFEYYVGGRPFSQEEGFNFEDALISFMDSVFSQLLVSGGKSRLIDLFFSVFEPRRSGVAVVSRACLQSGDDPARQGERQGRLEPATRSGALGEGL